MFFEQNGAERIGAEVLMIINTSCLVNSSVCLNNAFIEMIIVSNIVDN